LAAGLHPDSASPKTPSWIQGVGIKKGRGQVYEEGARGGKGNEEGNGGRGGQPPQ